VNAEVTRGPIAGIILAAGASSRMGSPKALLEYRGETFLDRLIRVFSGCCDPVIVVAGIHADSIRQRMDHVGHMDRRARLAINPDPDRGQLSSLQVALAQVPGDGAGFLFTPVDCPTVEEKTVAMLVDQLRKHDAPFVIPRYHGKRGHPVCARRSVIAEFLSLPPTAETRAIVNRHEERIRYVDVDDAGVLADVDDLEAYRKIAQ
jgi:molybdenum cofactor cytidylyltransferase